MDARWSDALLACLRRVEPLVAHVDEHVARVEQREQRGDRGFDGLAGRDKEHHAPRALERRDEVGESGEGAHLEAALLRRRLHCGIALGGIQVEARNRTAELLSEIESELQRQRPTGT